MYVQIKRLRWDVALLCGVAGILSCGCSGDGTKLGAVSGIVTLDGQPLENASVSFHPSKGRGSFGTTDAEGRYVLEYHKGRKGATAGHHKVTITTKVWTQPSRSVDYEVSARDKKKEAGKPRSELLPAKYRVREQTVLSADVVLSGANEHNFDLKSK